MFKAQPKDLQSLRLLQVTAVLEALDEMLCRKIVNNTWLVLYYIGREAVRLGMCFPVHPAVFSSCNTLLI